LFFGTYNCASCHNPFPGPYLTDVPKDIGLENNPVDLGFGGITGKADQMGRFKTPNLKNVALTAPYMHDGRFETLDEVLEHYSTGIKSSVNLDPSLKDQYGNPKKMNITEKDKKSLKAFLNALTDYSLVTDVKFSDPFKQ
jgi:cytochrome c peroxidase